MEKIDFVRRGEELEVRLVLTRRVSKRGDRYYIAVPKWAIRSGLIKPGEKYTVVISTKPYEELLKRELEEERQLWAPELEEEEETVEGSGWEEIVLDEDEDEEEELDGVVLVEELDDEDWDIIDEEDEDI